MADGPSTPNAVRQPRPQSPVVQGKNNDAENVGQLNTRLERYLIKVRDLAKQNEDLKAKLAKLKGAKNPGAFNATDELKGKLDALAAEKKDLEGALNDLDKKNGDKRRAVDLLKRENEGNAEELAQKEKDILALNQAIGHLQDRPKVADPQRFNEIELLKEKIKEKEAEIKKMKENAQEDFEKALENEKLIWKTHEDDVKKELADHYAKKTNELDDKIKKLREQLEILKKAKGQEQATLNSLNDRLERLRRERAALILELDKKKDDTLNKIKVAVAERADEVEVLKRLSREKEQDLHGHEKQNVEFKDEIRKYEEILEAEEKRYSLDSHSKKRKLEDAPVAAPALVSAPAALKNPVAAPGRVPLPTNAPVFNSPFRGAQQPDAAEQGSHDVGSVAFKVSKSGRVQIKEISSVSLKIYNLTKDDIDMSGWFIQAVPSANPTKPQKFKFPENEQLPSEGTLIVKVASEEKNEPFDGSQYGPGSYIQILDKEDILVSQVEISHDGQPGDRRGNCISM